MLKGRRMNAGFAVALALAAGVSRAVEVTVEPGTDRAVALAAANLRLDLDRACPGHRADARRIHARVVPDGRREASVRTYANGVWTVTGSDRRGAIYGIYAISEAIGVSPFHWWDDVPVVPRPFALSEEPFEIAPPAVRLRGVFINDEDWSLMPWCKNTFAKAGEKSIGVAFHEKFFEMMQRLRLNWFWPAMHEGGFEFVTEPAVVDLADRYAIVLGSSHCEPMMRNNVYLDAADKPKWDFAAHPDFLRDYWNYAPSRYADREIVWTLGMRGIHDSKMKAGLSVAESVRRLNGVFDCQLEILGKAGVAKPDLLFVPYNEVMTLFNAGAAVPPNATVMWSNDNFGYVRRTGGPALAARPQGIYWHVGYYGYPHSYVHLCTTSPAFLWYELAAKCAANGVRDAWMVNVGDGKPADILMFALGKVAWNPDGYGADAGPRLVGEWARSFLGGVSPDLVSRIVRHLSEYYALGTRRKPELMCLPWVASLSAETRAALLARYDALFAEDEALEAALPATHRDAWFDAIGYQVRFLAEAGRAFMRAVDDVPPYAELKTRTAAAIDALTARYEALADGKWKGFWFDTVRESYHLRGDVKNPYSSAFSVMQWPWNELPGGRVVARDCNFVATQGEVAWRDAARGCEPVRTAPGTGDAGFARVPGLGPQGEALALLPVGEGLGDGAWAEYELTAAEGDDTVFVEVSPEYALHPGLPLTFAVSVNGAIYRQPCEVPFAHANYGSFGSDPRNTPRHAFQQDNFARVTVRVDGLAAGRNVVRVWAVEPGLVISRVGVLRGQEEERR